MRWIVLLRGINVGGHGKTPMAELRKALEQIGATNVATYIQSGNLIFDHADPQDDLLAERVSDLIQSRFGHRPSALALRPDSLRTIHDATPFPPDADPKLVHLHLFRDPPAPDALATLNAHLYSGEELILAPTCLYHWPPKGFGISKVAQKIPKALGVTTTARNLRTIRAILDLA